MSIDMTNTRLLNHPAGEPKPEAEATPIQKLRARVCLACARAFESEWVGERICRKCKSSANWRQG